MEPVNLYVSQARDQGLSDDQIRKALLNAGWDETRISSALGASAVPTQVSPPNLTQPVNINNLPQSDQLATLNHRPISQNQAALKPLKSKPNLKLLVPTALVAVLVIGAIVYGLSNKSNGYQSVINQFITAIQQKDKTKADSLETANLKANYQKYVGNPSFYTDCQKDGVFCEPLLRASFINKATKTTKAYTSSSGQKGKEVSYSFKQAASGSKSGDTGCSSNSDGSLMIAAVPSGNSWLIDYINIDLGFNANLCQN